MLQNGVIDDFMKNSEEKPKINHILVFSQSDAQYFNNHFIGRISIAGSLRNNMCTIQKDKTGEIAWISTWVDGHKASEKFKLGNGEIVNFEDFNGCEATSIINVGEWCRENGFHLSIAGSTLDPSSASREKNFFIKVLQDNSDVQWEYFPRKYLSNYNLVDKHKLIISIDSALALEALSRGAKVAIISCRSQILNLSDRRFGYPINLPLAGSFWTSTTLKSEISNFLSKVYLMNEQDYFQNVNSQKEILMPYDYGNTVLNKIINETLNLSEGT
jgi:surface carbohydrate biosynthesis protein